MFLSYRNLNFKRYQIYQAFLLALGILLRKALSVARLPNMRTKMPLSSPSTVITDIFMFDLDSVWILFLGEK